MPTATYANEHSKPIADYCSIWVFAEGETENINSNTAINDSNNIAADNDNSDSHNSNGNRDHETYFWDKVCGTVIKKDLTDAYEKILHWKRNLYMMAREAVGKKYIKDIFCLLKLWIQDSPLKTTALKVIHVIPVLLLQYFRNLVKSWSQKDHLVSLERCLKLREEEDITNLLHEGETIQERMKISEKGMNIEKISLTFKNMSKGNVNWALKLLKENMSNMSCPWLTKLWRC